MKLKKLAAVLAAMTMMFGTLSVPANAITLSENAPAAAQLEYEPMPIMPEEISEGDFVFDVYPGYGDNSDYAIISGCNKNAETIEIPAEVRGVPVTGVNAYIFANCPALREITVAEGQTNFTSIDGVLFDAAGTKLIRYPLAKGERYDVPDGTIEIDTSAFKAPEGFTGLQEVTFPETLEKIGLESFVNQSGLKDIVLPNSLTDIYNYAFSNCKGLESVRLGRKCNISGYIMSGCTSLKTITGDSAIYTIEDNVVYKGTKLVLYPAGLEAASYTVKEGTKEIDSDAISYCEALEEVILPDSLTYINSGFSELPNLKSLTIPEGVGVIQRILIDCPSLEMVSLPSTLEYCGYGWLRDCPALHDVYFAGTEEYFFAIQNMSNCEALRSSNVILHFGDEAENTTGVYDYFTYKKFADHIEIASYNNPTDEFIDPIVIPEEIEGLPVTVIGMDAFRNHGDVWGITIPESVTEIDAYAFCNCKNLTGLTLPENLQILGESAFAGCENVTEIDIPANMTEVGKGVFARTGLTEVTIPDGTEYVWDTMFANCTDLETVHIPDSVTTIGEGAFRYCRSLTSIELPDSITTLNSYAFAGSGLTSFDFPKSIESIGSSCFADCSNLTSIEIPPSITEIRTGTFEDTGLREIVIPETVTAIQNYAFYRCSSLYKITIMNPDCDIDMYSTTICTDEIELPPDGCIIEVEYLCLAEIHGWKGSTAEEYANEFAYSLDLFVPLDDKEGTTDETTETTATEDMTDDSVPMRGDIDGSGSIDIVDVIVLNKYLLLGEELTADGIANADADGNGTVNATDSLHLLKYVVKIIDTLV